MKKDILLRIVRAANNGRRRTEDGKKKILRGVMGQDLELTLEQIPDRSNHFKIIQAVPKPIKLSP